MSSPEPFSDWLRRQQAENPHGAVTEQWATQLLALGASWDTFRDRTADLVVNDLMTVCDIPLLAALDIVRRAQDEIARSQAPLAVFWDLEQVPLFVGEKDDNGILCTETIRELQSLLKPYGSLQRFGCYGTLSNPRQQQLTLQLLGCQHVETSDNSSQEVTIAVDAMEFSHNHPDGAVVCFVTSEADRYAHLLATLQRRPHCRTMTVTTRVPSKQVQDMPKNTFWLTKTTRSSSNPLDTKIPIEKVVSFEQNQPQQPPPPLNRNSDTSSKTATNDNSQSQAHQTQTDTQFTHEKSSPPDSIPAKKETSHQDDDGTNKQVYTPTPSASAFESVNLKEWFKAKSNAANDHKDLSSSSSSGAGDNQQDDDYDDDDDNEADDLMSLLTQEEFDYPYYSNNSPTKQTSASSSNEDDNNNSIDNSDNNNNHHHRHDAEDIDYSDPTNRETWEQDVGYLKALIKRYSKSPSFSVRKDHVLSMLRLRNADRFPKKRLIAALGRAIEMGIVLEHSSSNELDDDKNAAVPTLSLPPTNGSSLTRPKLLEPADTLPHGLKLQLETIPERVAHVSSTMPFALFAHRRNFPAGSIMPRGPYVVNLKKDWLILMFRTQKDAQRTVDEDLPVALGNSAILVDCRRHPEFLQGAANNNSKRRPEENGEEEQRCPTPRSSVSSVPVGGKDQVEVLHGDTDAKKNGKAVAANCGGDDEKKEDHTVATNSRIDRGGKPKRNAVTNDGSNDNRLSQISLQEANQKQPRRQRNRRRRQSGGSNSSSPTQELSSPQTTSTTSSSSSVESSPGAGIDKKLVDATNRRNGPATNHFENAVLQNGKDKHVTSAIDVRRRSSPGQLQGRRQQTRSVSANAGHVTSSGAPRQFMSLTVLRKKRDPPPVVDDNDTIDKEVQSQDETVVRDVVGQNDSVEGDWEDVEEDANCFCCGATLLESDIIFAPKVTTSSETSGGREITCLACYPWKGEKEKQQATNRVVSLLIVMAEYDDIYVEEDCLRKHIHRAYPGHCTTVKHAELWIDQAVKSEMIAPFEHKQLQGTFYCLRENLPYASREFPTPDFNTSKEENHITNLLVKANGTICRKEANASLRMKFPSMHTPFLRARVFANGEKRQKFFLVKDSFHQAIGFTEHDAQALVNRMKRTHLAK